MYTILKKLDDIENLLQPQMDPRFREVMKELLEKALVNLLMTMCPTKGWGNIWNWDIDFARSVVDDVKTGRLNGLKQPATPQQVEKLESYMHCYFILHG